MQVQLQFGGRTIPQLWIIIFCVVAVCFYRLINNTHRFPPDRFLQCRSSDRIGGDGAITLEVLRRINWTMVLGPRGINYAPRRADMSKPYFGVGRYVRPIDSSS